MPDDAVHVVAVVDLGAVAAVEGHAGADGTSRNEQHYSSAAHVGSS